ncbi:MAG: 2,3-bisphosphoglycerate-independent phosphoglycerate mutase [bacterium]|nr:2,3-bisphosphoglycerate-independent phosphoglycerate mutase [bacterium]
MSQESPITAATDPSAPKVVLCILDGVGYRSGPGSEVGNAVIGAHPQFYESLLRDYPFTTLSACGLDVGLPEGQMGNSEVGHLTIGAGRVINQELVRISRSLEEGDFAVRPAWTGFADACVAEGGRLHLLGLVSPGGVHSHTEHLYGIVAEAKKRGFRDIFIHAFLDGRDTDPQSGRGYVAELQQQLDRIGAGRIATVCGRYWAMDRDKRWDRVLRGWNLVVDGTLDAKGHRTTDAVAAIAASYAAGVTDEFMEPTVVTDATGAPLATVRDGDGIFFWNFRADRARELTWAFKQPGFDGFPIARRPRVHYLTMTPYDEKLDLPSIYAPEPIRLGLPEILAQAGLRNLRTAETEKYAHVTYFFNGGREEPWPGEVRRLVPSPKVATYDLQPEMSAPEVAAVLKEACLGSEFDVIVVNFANGDMVGHTGIYEAAVRAIATLDRLLGDVMPPSLARGTTWLVTADHGNCDEMLGPDGEVMTQHSLNRVPFILAGRSFAGKQGILRTDAKAGLADIAPTILQLLGLPQPAVMTGHSLLITES